MLSNKNTTMSNPFIKQVDREGFPTKKALKAGAKKEYLCADGGLIVLRWHQGVCQVEHLSNKGEELSLYESHRISSCIRKFKQSCNGR